MIRNKLFGKHVSFGSFFARWIPRIIRIESACTRRSSRLYHFRPSVPVSILRGWILLTEPIESTFLRVDSQSRQLIQRIRAILMKKRRVSADFSKREESTLSGTSTTKKRRVEPTLLHKWVYRKSGKWIRYKKSRLAKSQCICPQSSFMNMDKNSRLFSA